MNIYISGTPEISIDTIDEAVSFLSSINGPINFIPLQPVSKKWTTFRKSDIEKNDDSYIILSDLKQIATLLRLQFNEIEDEDLVVILTSITLNFMEFNYPKKWFSHFNANDVYIRTYNWSHFTDNKPNLAICHQVLENTLQILNGNVGGKFDYYHNTPEGGCINALCINELEIVYKINTGKICNSCQLKLKENNVQGGYVLQIKSLLSKIAAEANSLKTDLFENKEIKIEIDKKGDIYIDGFFLDLDEKPRAFYIFLILYDNIPFTFNELKSKKEVIVNIYNHIKRNNNMENVIYNFFGFELKTTHTYDKTIGEIENFEIIKRVPECSDSENHKRMRKIRNEIKTTLKTISTLVSTKLFEVKSIGSVGKTPKFIFSYPKQLIQIDKSILQFINRTS